MRNEDYYYIGRRQRGTRRAPDGVPCYIKVGEPSVASGSQSRTIIRRDGKWWMASSVSSQPPTMFYSVASADDKPPPTGWGRDGCVLFPPSAEMPSIVPLAAGAVVSAPIASGSPMPFGVVAPPAASPFGGGAASQSPFGAAPAGGALFGSPASATASPFAPAPAASSPFGAPRAGGALFGSPASATAPPSAPAPAASTVFGPAPAPPPPALVGSPEAASSFGVNASPTFGVNASPTSVGECALVSSLADEL